MSDASMKVESGNFDIEMSPDIGALQEDLEYLEAQGILTPFQTRAWLSSFYAVLAPRLKVKPLFILIRDRASRLPVLLLPLCLRNRSGITIIEFADLGVSDYNAPLMAQAFDSLLSQWQELWQSVLKLLATRGSLLRLEKMPERIGDRANPLARYNKKAVLMDIASWGVALPATFDDYNTHIIHPSFAKELAKKVRRVAKRGDMDYVVAQTREEKRVLFDILARQRQARCDEMGRFNILRQADFRKFYEAVAVESSEALVSLSLLKVGGEIVGGILALNRQKAVHVIMSTYQGGDWKSCSLGNVIIRSAIEHAIGAGVGFFDFTIGNEGYKQHFGASSSALYSLLQPLGPTGFFVVFIMTCYTRIKKIAKLCIRMSGTKDMKVIYEKQGWD